MLSTVVLFVKPRGRRAGARGWEIQYLSGAQLISENVRCFRVAERHTPADVMAVSSRLQL